MTKEAVSMVLCVRRRERGANIFILLAYMHEVAEWSLAGELFALTWGRHVRI
jgi:hypothetical protein